ncbi:MAG: dihydrofolate reductase [Spirochaetes bacterium]|nr:MAG: dihydrofolate reductase [Spirochaetota bacterium]
MSTVSIIVAVDEGGVIGNNGSLPNWHAPGDLKRFKELTVGKSVIMGRKTYESLGKPLPNRWNIVLSRSLLEGTGIHIVRSWEEAMSTASIFSQDSEVMVIGGSEVYTQALPVASRVYLTRVYGRHSGDAFFPPLDPQKWVVVKEEVLPTHSYLIYERRVNK